LVDPHNTDEIAVAMQRIWHEPELRADLVQKGRQQRLLFSWDEAAEKIYSLLESVVQKNQ
jgi:glycosyltransferase involved in cell wall biosynthesis